MAMAFNHNLQRGKKLANLTLALGKGFWLARRVGALQGRAKRQDLVMPIQHFCQSVCDAIGVRVQVHGQIPKMHGLWVSNHVSWVDIPVIGAMAQVFFLSKAEIANWPIVGRLVRAGGTLFIHRGTGDALAVATQMANFLQQGHSVVFFPEATTTDGRAIKRIHGKLLQASIDTKLPICPVVLCYSKDGTPSDAIPYFGKMSMKDSVQKVLDAQGHIAHIMALTPIYPSQDDTIATLTDRLTVAMQAGLEALHAKAYQHR